MPWRYAGLHGQSQSAGGDGEEPIQSYSGNPEVLLNRVALKILRASGRGLPTVASRLGRGKGHPLSGTRETWLAIFVALEFRSRVESLSKCSSRIPGWPPPDARTRS